MGKTKTAVGKSELALILDNARGGERDEHARRANGRHGVMHRCTRIVRGGEMRSFVVINRRLIRAFNGITVPFG